MTKTDKKGHLFVISGPSGVGKGTLLSALLKNHPDIKLSISATTRKPRPGEIHGVNYFFTTVDDFKALIQKNELLEWAEFAGNFYGTYQKTVQESLDNGHDLALEIDVQGALQVKNKIKDAILIFILPPSMEELKARLEGRNTETQEAIAKRLSIVENELKHAELFNYKVINNEFDTALKELENIIIAERGK